MHIKVKCICAISRGICGLNIVCKQQFNLCTIFSTIKKDQLPEQVWSFSWQHWSLHLWYWLLPVQHCSLLLKKWSLPWQHWSLNVWDRSHTCNIKKLYLFTIKDAHLKDVILTPLMFCCSSSYTYLFQSCSVCYYTVLRQM